MHAMLVLTKLVLILDTCVCKFVGVIMALLMCFHSKGAADNCGLTRPCGFNFGLGITYMTSCSLGVVIR